MAPLARGATRRSGQRTALFLVFALGGVVLVSLLSRSVSKWCAGTVSCIAATAMSERGPCRHAARAGAVAVIFGRPVDRR